MSDLSLTPFDDHTEWLVRKGGLIHDEMQRNRDGVVTPIC